jgi:hypothetical protein
MRGDFLQLVRQPSWTFATHPRQAVAQGLDDRLRFRLSAAPGELRGQTFGLWISNV